MQDGDCSTALVQALGGVTPCNRMAGHIRVDIGRVRNVCGFAALCERICNAKVTDGVADKCRAVAKMRPQEHSTA